MNSAVGIDVGANSCVVALAGKGGVDIVVNDVSNRETPCVVGFSAAKRCIGEAGLNEAGKVPKQTLSGLKQLLGRRFAAAEVAEELNFTSCDLKQAPSGGVLMAADVSGSRREICMEALLAMMLKHLLEQIRVFRPVAADPKYVVMALPAHFDMRQRKAYLDAAAISGISVKRVINEHAAVALNYGLTKKELKELKEPRLVLFVDFGHTSLTATVVSFMPGVLTVKSVSSDLAVGGRTLTTIVTDFFVATFKKKTGIDLKAAKYGKALARVQRESEKVKKILSANTVANMQLECLAEDKDLACSFTREQLDEAAAPMYAKFIKPLEQALADAGVAKEDLFAVEAVGNSRTVPAFKTTVSKWFGRELSRTMDASEACARGCALLAAACSPGFQGAIKTYKMIDVTSQFASCVGEAKPKDVLCQVDSSAPLPAVQIGQINGPVKSPLRVTVLQAESAAGLKSARDQERVISFEATGIPKGASGASVRITVDDDNLVHVDGHFSVQAAAKPEEPAAEDDDAEDESAAEEDSAEEATCKAEKGEDSVEWVPFVCTGPGLSKKQLTALRQEEEEMAEQDRVFDATEEMRNALEAYILRAKHAVGGEWKSFIVDATASKLSAQLDKAEDWLYTDEGYDADLQALTAQLQTLSDVGDPVSERCTESVKRPEATQAATDKIAELQTNVEDASQNNRCTPEAVEKAKKKCQDVKSWMEEKNKKQAKQKLTEKVVVTAAEIRSRTDELESSVKQLLLVKPRWTNPLGGGDEESWMSDPQVWASTAVVMLVAVLLYPLTETAHDFMRFGQDHSADYSSDPLTFRASLSGLPAVFTYIQHQTLGSSPGATAFASLVLHIFNALCSFHVSILVLSVSELVDLKALSALGLASCLFAVTLLAVHPVVIGVVAWSGGQATLLSCSMSLLCVHCQITHRYGSSDIADKLAGYLGGYQVPRPLVIFGVIACLAGETCSSAVAAVPAALFCAELYLQKTSWKILFEDYAPYALCALCTLGISPADTALENELLLPGTGDCSVADALTQPIYTAGFYVVKLFAPVNLLFYQPVPTVADMQASLMLIVPLCTAALLLVLVLVRLLWVYFKTGGSIASDRFLLIAAQLTATLVSYMILMAPQAMCNSVVLSNKHIYAVLLTFGAPLLAFLCSGLHQKIVGSSVVDWLAPTRSEQAMILVSIAAIGCSAWFSQAEIAAWQSPYVVWQRCNVANATDAVVLTQVGAELRRVSQSKLPEAIHYHEQALLMQPDHPTALHEFALSLDQSGRSEEAVHMYDTAVEYAPQNNAARLAYAESLEQLGRFADAEFHLQSIIQAQNHATPVRILTRLGQQQQQQGKMTEAASAFLAAVDLKPNMAAALKGLGDISAHEGKWTEAEQYLTQAVEASPRRRAYQKSLSAAQVHNGYGLAEAGKLDEALERYESAIRRDSRTVSGLNNAGVLLHSQGRLSEATTVLQKAAAVADDNADVQMNLGVVAAAVGRWKAAIQHFQKAAAVLVLDPALADATKAAGEWVERIEAERRTAVSAVRDWRHAPEQSSAEPLVCTTPDLSSIAP